MAYLLAKESAGAAGRPRPYVMPWKYNGNRPPPMQKSAECLVPQIECFSRSRDIVLDPLADSGSTSVAARQVGRRSYSIEMDPKYQAAALSRDRCDANARPGKPMQRLSTLLSSLWMVPPLPTELLLSASTPTPCAPFASPFSDVASYRHGGVRM